MVSISLEPFNKHYNLPTIATMASVSIMFVLLLQFPQVAVSLSFDHRTKFSHNLFRGNKLGTFQNGFECTRRSNCIQLSFQREQSILLESEILATVSENCRLTDGSKQQLQQLPPALEQFLGKLDEMYTHYANEIRCPFFRRRTADMIDSVAAICRFLVCRHKSLGLPFITNLLLDDQNDERLQPPGCKAIGRHVRKNSDGSICKQRGLSIEKIAEIIKFDWRPFETLERNKGESQFINKKSINKGYYITGRLDSTIYRDDCLFDGPDPDMPVRGLRKYLSAASHLFDHNQSYARLLSIECNESGGKYGKGVIIVHWELGGVLMLPWKPIVKPWTGSTKYHLDESNLIVFHEEAWDISALEAFI